MSRIIRGVEVDVVGHGKPFELTEEESQQLVEELSNDAYDDWGNTEQGEFYD